jgi:hypothetical protein
MIKAIYALNRSSGTNGIYLLRVGKRICIGNSFLKAEHNKIMNQIMKFILLPCINHLEDTIFKPINVELMGG